MGRSMGREGTFSRSLASKGFQGDSGSLRLRQLSLIFGGETPQVLGLAGFLFFRASKRLRRLTRSIALTRCAHNEVSLLQFGVPPPNDGRMGGTRGRRLIYVASSLAITTTRAGIVVAGDGACVAGRCFVATTFLVEAKLSCVASYCRTSRLCDISHSIMFRSQDLKNIGASFMQDATV